MTFMATLIGALTLRQQTFVALRERSDVFLRGFMVLLVVGLVVGFFMGLETASGQVIAPPSKEEVIARAMASFDSTYNGPPEMRPVIEAYMREGISMVYEIIALTPRGGEVARPVATVLTVVGTTLATPFSWAWTGWMLFAGLLFHLTSRWLGGRARIAQMLGLTALAAAPQILLALNGVLGAIGNVSGAPLGFLVSLISYIVSIWSAVVYVKAMSVAQGFSWVRALGAIALGYLLLIGVFLVLLLMFGLIVGLIVVPVTRAIQ